MNEKDTANPTVATRLNRIRRVSHLFQRLCVVVIGTLVIFAVYALFAPIAPPPEESRNEINATQVVPKPPGVLAERSPTFITRTHVRSYAFGLGQPLFHLDSGSIKSPWLLRLFGVISALCLSGGVVILYRLFGLYKTGAIFTAANVHCYKLCGFWLLGLWVLTHLFELSKLAWSRQPQMHFTLDERFLGGLLILVIAWVMEEGRELQEEHDLTI